MAKDASIIRSLQPPAVAALRNEAEPGSHKHRHAMERSFSQDIQEGTQELKQAAELTRNIILDVSLDGIIRWVSPSWTDVVGTQLESVKGKPISSFIHDDPHAFESAIESLKSNTSKSQFIKFAIQIGTQSDLSPMLASHKDALRKLEGRAEDEADDEPQKALLELEGQGIMVYDRASGKQSHTMWMLQPATEPVQVTISLPQNIVEVLGVGAEILAKYLNEITEAGTDDPGSHPPPLPIICRVCERSVVPWWFEKHSDLCVQEHKAEMDVQMVQESLTEHRHAIVKVLDAFETRQGRSHGDSATNNAIGPEYKGMSIGPSPASSSGISSTSASLTPSPARSRSPSTNPKGHHRARSFIVRRPLVRIVELILDLCDTALEISTPSIRDGANGDDDNKAQSPQSESRISQVLQWQQPSSIDAEPGLAALSADTEHLAKGKVEAVFRHQQILEYSERIRIECHEQVYACIQDALEKARRAAAGESISSAESESDSCAELDDLLEMDFIEEPTPLALEPEGTRRQSYVGMKATSSALHGSQVFSQLSTMDQRRSSSQAVSTGSNSPVECPTPKSHRGNTISQPQPISARRSVYLESDANDSDGSLPSTSVTSSHWRAESPASVSDHGVTRQTSARDRKRRSMHLHGLGSASPHRQQSPGRYPPPPPSPLRSTLR